MAQTRAVFGWTRETEIGKGPAESTPESSQQSQVDSFQENAWEDVQKEASLKLPLTSEDHVLADVTASIDGSAAQLNPDQGLATNITDILGKPDLTQRTAEVMTTNQSGIRGSIRKALQSGVLDIPPFKPANDTSLSADKRITYQLPPALLESDYISTYRKLFDRSALVPDSNLPLSSQIMGFCPIWAMWIAEIAEEAKREKLLDRVFDMATKAWFEALRLGYKPDTGGAETATPRTPAKRPVLPGEDIPSGLRGRPRPKKETDPLQMPVLTAFSHKDGPRWPITAGELQAAGISMTRLQRRAADKSDLVEAGDELLRKVLQMYNGQIAARDWFDVEERTKLNPLGRDLQVYCLYEVLKSRDSIAQLRSYFAKFKTVKQKENTQRRIDEEQERQDLFAALALELEEDNPRSPTPSVFPSTSTREGSVSSAHMTKTAEISDLDRFRSLVNAIESTLKDSNFADMITTFELYGMSEGDLISSTPFEDISSDFDRCQRVMQEMLFDARDWLKLLQNGQAQDVNIQELEMQINKKKEILRGVYPSLLAELDAAKTAVGDDDAAASVVEDEFVSSDNDELMTEVPESAPTGSTKRSLDAEADDALGTQSPDTKKQKTVDEERALRIEVPAPLVQLGVDERDGGPFASTGATAPTIELPASNSLQQPSLLVKLRTRPGFDPETLTSTKIFYQDGFRYRYSPESTLAQRFSINDTLRSYIGRCTQQHISPNNEWRYGRYQGLIHVDDPSRTTIVHGVWDLEDGSQPAGFERFYNGDAEYTAVLEDTFMSETDGEEAEPRLPSPPLRKRKSNTKSGRKGATRSRQEDLRSTAVDTEKGRVGGRGRSKTRANSTINHHGVITRAKSAKPRVRLLMKPVPVPQERFVDDSISMNRPKRRGATRKSYAEDLDDNDDDDYAPDEEYES
ncbi:hypothetical protein G647_02487 [Cladophialophora carrionii CBS 160.54]|uniref:Uncharacterized protein n=1 Tax=Cladophialophora carrionii CBS 160.54 TaxID=1279043 RepID=V9DHA7_9EURO|nr:uncharacterized protein G647_02487 [Cladophialophora carrionii CBS 160.54]ETI25713.1 hypothetical protein G647_02487 [Cladophialophora carrionii CBS 160.54]